MTQGIGYALSEELVYEGGIVRNPTLTDFKMPTSMDVPNVEAQFVEAGSDERARTGRRASASRRSCPPGAAIANAVADATGVRILRLPLTAERVLTAIQDAGQPTA